MPQQHVLHSTSGSPTHLMVRVHRSSFNMVEPQPALLVEHFCACSKDQLDLVLTSGTFPKLQHLPHLGSEAQLQFQLHVTMKLLLVSIYFVFILTLCTLNLIYQVECFHSCKKSLEFFNLMKYFFAKHFPWVYCEFIVYFFNLMIGLYQFTTFQLCILASLFVSVKNLSGQQCCQPRHILHHLS